MPSAGQNLLFQFLADVTDFEKGTNRVISDLERVERKAMHVSASVFTFFSGIAATAVMISDGARQTELVFKTLTGSANDAKDVMKEISDFQFESDFAIGDIQGSTLAMVKMGATVGDINKQLELFGSFAAGTGESLSAITTSFMQVQQQGTLTRESFDNLSSKGIFDMQSLADALGITREEMEQVVEDGTLGFDELMGAMDKIKDSKFSTALADQNSSLSASFADLLLTLKPLMKAIGDELAPYVRKATEYLKEWSQWIRDQTPIIAKAAAGVVVWGAALSGLATTLAVVRVALIASASQIGIWGTAVKIATGLSTGMKAGLVGLLAMATAFVSYKIGETIAGWFGLNPVKEYNEELERSKEFAEALLKTQREGNAEAMKRVKDAATPGEKGKIVEEEMERAQRSVKALQMQFNLQKKAAEEMEPTWLSFGQWGKKAWEAQSSQAKEAKTRLEEQKKAVEELAKEQGDLEKNAKGELVSRKDTAEAKNLLKTLKDELEITEKIGTKTGNARKIEELALKNVNEDLIEKLKLANEELETEQKRQQSTAALEDYVKSLKASKETMGMTAEEARLWQAAQDGVSRELIETARGLEEVNRRELERIANEEKIKQANKDATEELKRRKETLGLTSEELELYNLKQQGVARDTVNAFERQQKAEKEHAEATDKYNKLRSDSLSVIEGLKTRQEKYTETLDNLNKMLNTVDKTTGNTLLTQEQYSKAVEKAKHEYDDAAEAYKNYLSELRIGGSEFDATEEGIVYGAAGLFDKQTTAAGSATTGPLADIVETITAPQLIQPPKAQSAWDFFGNVSDDAVASQTLGGATGTEGRRGYEFDSGVFPPAPEPFNSNLEMPATNTTGFAGIMSFESLLGATTEGNAKTQEQLQTLIEVTKGKKPVEVTETTLIGSGL